MLTLDRAILLIIGSPDSHLLSSMKHKSFNRVGSNRHSAIKILLDSCDLHFVMANRSIHHRFVIGVGDDVRWVGTWRPSSTLEGDGMRRSSPPTSGDLPVFAAHPPPERRDARIIDRADRLWDAAEKIQWQNSMAGRTAHKITGERDCEPNARAATLKVCLANGKTSQTTL
jgi:hypothetical protein